MYMPRTVCLAHITMNEQHPVCTPYQQHPTSRFPLQKPLTLFLCIYLLELLLLNPVSHNATPTFLLPFPSGSGSQIGGGARHGGARIGGPKIGAVRGLIGRRGLTGVVTECGGQSARMTIARLQRKEETLQ